MWSRTREEGITPCFKNLKNLSLFFKQMPNTINLSPWIHNFNLYFAIFWNLILYESSKLKVWSPSKITMFNHFAMYSVCPNKKFGNSFASHKSEVGRFWLHKSEVGLWFYWLLKGNRSKVIGLIAYVKKSLKEDGIGIIR